MRAKLSREGALVLVATLCLATPATAASRADLCTAGLQVEMGKAYACMMKAYSKASKRGQGEADLTRCQSSFERKLERLATKYGGDCPDFDAQFLTGLTEQWSEDSAAVSTGTPWVDTGGGLTTTACTAATVYDGQVRKCVPANRIFAKDPPIVAAMDLRSKGNGRADFSVSYEGNQLASGRKLQLPGSMELKLSAKSTVTLVREAGTFTYSGEVPYLTAEWDQFNQALQQSANAAGGNGVPVFDGRVRLDQLVPATQPATLSTGEGSTGEGHALMPAIFPASIDPERTLMVRDVSVVEDPERTFDVCAPDEGTPMGAWTFGHLITEMANERLTGIDPSDLVLDWLSQWTVDQPVGLHVDADQQIPARTEMLQIIDKWGQDSESNGLPPGKLDLSIAPFRLMAIVNRVDLRENSLYGGGNCGEGRFVFGLIDTREGGGGGIDPTQGPGSQGGSCKPAPFTVIFEYGVNIDNCKSCKRYADRWLDLQQHEIGSTGYLEDLESIARVFTERNTNSNAPNGSSLNQIRTNENELDPEWELREFNLSVDNGLLHHVTTKQTPDLDLNGTKVLEDWVNLNAELICSGSFTVPEDFPMDSGEAFLGVHVPYDLDEFWDGALGERSIPNRCARFQLGLGTCNGCHASAENGTKFTHVGASGQRQLGQPASLSGFLTGISVPDPADEKPIRDFHDLERRQIDLWKAANLPCLPTIAFKPLLMTH